MRRGYDEGGLRFAPLLLRDGREVGARKLPVAVALGHLLDPAELIQLLEGFRRPALAQRLGGFLVVAFLAKDLFDLCDRQARPLLQELERLAGRNAAVLAAVTD